VSNIVHINDEVPIIFEKNLCPVSQLYVY